MPSALCHSLYIGAALMLLLILCIPFCAVSLHAVLLLLLIVCIPFLCGFNRYYLVWVYMLFFLLRTRPIRAPYGLSLQQWCTWHYRRDICYRYSILIIIDGT